MAHPAEPPRPPSGALSFDNDPATLTRRIRDGDPGAEQTMVTRYSRGVTFLLRELTGDPTRADDLHQETFCLVLEKIRGGELRDPDKLGLFIRQIARYLFIAECRKHTKHPHVGGEEAIVWFGPDGSPSPLKRLLDKENARIVQRLLTEMEPLRDREILLRFVVAGHPKEEICDDLGLSSLHFNRVLHRARKRLKDRWTQHHRQGSVPRTAAVGKPRHGS